MCQYFWEICGNVGDGAFQKILNRIPQIPLPNNYTLRKTQSTFLNTPLYLSINLTKCVLGKVWCTYFTMSAIYCTHYCCTLYHLSELSNKYSTNSYWHKPRIVSFYTRGVTLRIPSMALKTEAKHLCSCMTFMNILYDYVLNTACACLKFTYIRSWYQPDKALYLGSFLFVCNSNSVAISFSYNSIRVNQSAKTVALATAGQ